MDLKRDGGDGAKAMARKAEKPISQAIETIEKSRVLAAKACLIGERRIAG
jgi:hypothetical protein